MFQRRNILLLIAALVIVSVSYWAATLQRALGAPTPVAVSLDLESPPSAPGMDSTDQLIKFWRGRFERDPRDYISLTFLGEAFIRKGRETGDVSQYESAETALNKALAINPNYDGANAYLSAVRFVKHDFRGALNLANRLHADNPSALQPLATIGDAQLELGNYPDAETAYQQFLDRNPSPAVYSRVARLAWLKGDPDKAIQWMKQAVDETAELELSGENAAWYQFQLGELYFNTGHPEEAATLYNAALDSFHNYYLALAALGKVRAAQGRYAEAIGYYQRAVAIIPQPDFLAALGDLYAITGQMEQAQSQYGTVQFIGKLAAINQVIYNRQLALFDANHDQKLSEALDLASKEAAVRKDIYSDDTLAWALYKNGRAAEASTAMDQAMKLGTQDALLYYHAGMIDQSLGHRQQAQALLTKALALNPHFDLLQARIAQAMLDQLGAH
jgi:tetratricopeptide (TPR) repeat protein